MKNKIEKVVRDLKTDCEVEFEDSISGFGGDGGLEDVVSIKLAKSAPVGVSPESNAVFNVLTDTIAILVIYLCLSC